MEKKPFLTEAMAQQIIEDVPTPFHVYDEKGIRENVRRINKAFSWNKGFRSILRSRHCRTLSSCRSSRRRAVAWTALP